MSSSPLVRPFIDTYLQAYSQEHVSYEFDMFCWLAQVCGGKTPLGAPTAEDARRLSNVFVEAFAMHLRNVIDFLYLDVLYKNGPQGTDIVAIDFFDPGVWQNLRPNPISQTLVTARVRANKEMAHLTTSRITGAPPEKAWEFVALANEIRPLLQLFAANALPSRLSPAVSTAIK